MEENYRGHMITMTTMTIIKIMTKIMTILTTIMTILKMIMTILMVTTMINSLRRSPVWFGLSPGEDKHQRSFNVIIFNDDDDDDGNDGLVSSLGEQTSKKPQDLQCQFIQ